MEFFHWSLVAPEESEVLIIRIFSKICIQIITCNNVLLSDTKTSKLSRNKTETEICVKVY